MAVFSAQTTWYRQPLDLFGRFEVDGFDVSGPVPYLHDQGLHRWVSYQPADRFWTLQLTETGIFVGLAVVLLALVVWRVNRRAF